MLGCEWAASSRGGCGGRSVRLLGRFWRVLGGVEAERGWKDFDVGQNGFVAEDKVALVLSLFL
jgi:hypothetical protein